MDQEAQLSDNIKAYGIGIDKINEIMKEIDEE